MNDKQKGIPLYQLVIIWVFAASIVAIGTKEIYVLQMKRAGVAKRTPQEFLKEMQGEIDIKKASVSKEHLSEIEKKSSENANAQTEKLEEKVKILLP